jgi:hypothetical protein
MTMCPPSGTAYRGWCPSSGEQGVTMASSDGVTTTADIPSPAELGPADSPDLVTDPESPDAPVDVLEEPVELAFESDEADAVAQILEVGYDEEHDGPA